MITPALKDDAFLTDVDAQLDSFMLHLWWLGQSGFLLKSRGIALLLDPYLSDSLTRKYSGTDKPHVRISERVVAPDRLRNIDLVVSTHRHTDHLDMETLEPILNSNPSAKLVVPRADLAFAAERLLCEPLRLIPVDVGEIASHRDVHVYPIPAAHDRIEKDQHGHTRYLGYVISLGRYTIFHSGDTLRYEGDVTAVFSATRKANLSKHDPAWPRAFPIDIAFLPINGKVGNMNGREAARLAKDIGAKLVIPCHYDMFEFNTADPREQFIPECERIGQPYRVLKLGERFTLNSQNPPER